MTLSTSATGKSCPAESSGFRRGSKSASEEILPESDADQNSAGLLYEFPFGILNVRKGQKHILPQQEFEIRRKERVRVPHPPRVQLSLQQAHEYQKRLQDQPSLTRAALARELGIDPSRLSQLLSLLNLTPEIQEIIMALEPTTGWGDFTEHQIRKIARMANVRDQTVSFWELRESEK